MDVHRDGPFLDQGLRWALGLGAGMALGYATLWVLVHAVNEIDVPADARPWFTSAFNWVVYVVPGVMTVAFLALPGSPVRGRLRSLAGFGLPIVVGLWPGAMYYTMPYGMFLRNLYDGPAMPEDPLLTDVWTADSWVKESRTIEDLNWAVEKVSPGRFIPADTPSTSPQRTSALRQDGRWVLAMRSSAGDCLVAAVGVRTGREQPLDVRFGLITGDTPCDARHALAVPLTPKQDWVWPRP